MKNFLVHRKHNSGADDYPKLRHDYDEAVNLVHEFFLHYDMEIKDGKPFDRGNDDGAEGGYECIKASFYGDKICEFTHCDGDGPVAWIEELENE